MGHAHKVYSGASAGFETTIGILRGGTPGHWRNREAEEPQ